MQIKQIKDNNCHSIKPQQVHGQKQPAENAEKNKASIYLPALWKKPLGPVNQQLRNLLSQV